MTARERWTDVTSEDARNRAILIAEICGYPNWQESRKQKRIALLLTMFSELDLPYDSPHPVLKLDYQKLAEAAHVKNQFAYRFVSWLMLRGYIVPVTKSTVAFSWHAPATGVRWHALFVPQGGDRDAPE